MHFKGSSIDSNSVHYKMQQVLWGMIYLVSIDSICGHSISINYTICTPTHNRHTVAHMASLPVSADGVVRFSA